MHLLSLGGFWLVVCQLAVQGNHAVVIEKQLPALLQLGSVTADAETLQVAAAKLAAGLWQQHAELTAVPGFLMQCIAADLCRCCSED